MLDRKSRREAPDANVLHLLADSAHRHRDRLALVHGDDSVTFGGLWERVGRAAGGYRRAGIEVGDTAIVMAPMSIGLYVAMLGLLHCGAVAVFVDPWIGARRMAAFAALARPRAFVGAPRAHLLRLFHPRLWRMPLAVSLGRRRAPFARRLAELEAGHVPAPPVAPRTADDSALVTFTTGSSGMPKGADRSHGFLVAQHRALAAALPYRADDVDMPLFPVFALNNLAWGIPSIVPPIDFRRVADFDPDRVATTMRRHGVTTLTASPPFVDRLAGIEEPPAQRRIVAGGAPVTDGQLRAWRRSFPRTEILVVYGSTEAEPVAHLTLEERLALAAERTTNDRPRGTCVGRPVPEIAARAIAIADGPVTLGGRGWAAVEVAPGEVGELVVTGEHVCRRYFRSPAAEGRHKIVAPDGGVWHRLGDTGYLDDEGRWWLVGRVHSTIDRGGSAVHPLLVEQAAQADDPRIRRVAAVGDGGGRVVVVVEVATTADDTDDESAVRRDVETRLRNVNLSWDEVVVTRRPLPVDPRHAAKVDHDRLRRRLRGWRSR